MLQKYQRHQLLAVQITHRGSTASSTCCTHIVALGQRDEPYPAVSCAIPSTMSTGKMQYGEYMSAISSTARSTPSLHSPPGQLGLEGLQDHPRNDAVWAQGLAGVGPRRGRGHRAHQIRVSTLVFCCSGRPRASLSHAPRLQLRARHSDVRYRQCMLRCFSLPA